MTHCMDCLRARSNPDYHGRNSDCPQCDIRAIARMSTQDRQAAYEHLERQAGGHAIATIKLTVREEMARIRNLRGNECRHPK